MNDEVPHSPFADHDLAREAPPAEVVVRVPRYAPPKKYRSTTKKLLAKRQQERERALVAEGFIVVKGQNGSTVYRGYQ